MYRLLVWICSYALTEGRHTLVWNFHRADTADLQPEAKAIIRSIVISGAVDGGASECVPCPSGFHQKLAQQDSCIPCDVGTFSQGTQKTEVRVSTACVSIPRALPRW
jgi:hypothetical protein